MHVTTTNGQRFEDYEHRALARLVFKRFGNDKESFCAAWRRMLQNDAPDEDILKLLQNHDPRAKVDLDGDLARATGRRYVIRTDLLDSDSCLSIRRLIRDMNSDSSSKVRRAKMTPWLP